MFTGLIADLGEVTALDEDGEGATLQIATRLAGELGEGDSIAVNGVCLTATEVRGRRASLRRRCARRSIAPRWERWRSARG